MLFDATNYVILLVVVATALRSGVITAPIAIALMLSCAVPFFLNDVLFPASYMPDQFRYATAVSELRRGETVSEAYTISTAASLLAMIPMPFITTIQSLGFFNKFLYVIIVLVIFYRYHVPLSVSVFLITYPSLVIYTGLSLRDTLVLCLMLVAIMSAINRKYLIAMIALGILTPLKFQNAAITTLIVIAHHVALRSGRRATAGTVFFTACLLVSGLLVVTGYYIDQLNLYRIAMHLEDGGRLSEISTISGTADLLAKGLLAGPYFLIKPLPWEASNAFQFIQSFENIVVLAYIMWFASETRKYDHRKTIFWIAALFVSAAVYGLVVVNFGTAARYRFPFIVVFIVGLAVDSGVMTRRRARWRFETPSPSGRIGQALTSPKTWWSRGGSNP